MTRLFDLPAHPLLVHFPIVAIPVLAIVALVMVFRPSTRERYGIAASVLGIITALATFLAAASGEAMVAEFGYTDETIDVHRSAGEALRTLVAGLTVMVISMTTLGKRGDIDSRHPVALLVSVGAIILASLSMIWVIRTGHAGAQSVWGSF